MSKPKLVSFVPFPEPFLTSLFQNKTPITITSAFKQEGISEEQTCQVTKDASVILAFMFPKISRKVMETAENLKLIQSYGAGYDSVDIKAATELGIPVANNPGWNSTSVAEHTLMLILMTLKKAIYTHRKSIEVGWKIENQERGKLVDVVWELKDKTLGLIGLGNIGKEVVKRAQAFGPKIIYYKRNRLSSEEESRLGVEYRNFKDLLAESDIVSLHLPINEETRGLIGVDEIGLMKDGAIIINTSRVGLVDEDAAAIALREGRLSGVGVDVGSSRNVDGFMRVESPLFEFENVVYTPHTGGSTKEAITRSHKQWVENVCRVLNGDKPFFIVNDL